MPRSSKTPSTPVPIPLCGRCTLRQNPGAEAAGERVAGTGAPGGTAPQISGTCQHSGCAAGVCPIRKTGWENRISKAAIFIRKTRKTVRSQLVGIQREMYRIVTAEPQSGPKETITKNRCKPSKNGLQRLFLAPPARLELTTFRLGGGSSILVRYGGVYRKHLILQGSRIRTVRLLEGVRSILLSYWRIYENTPFVTEKECSVC